MRNFLLTLLCSSCLLLSACNDSDGDNNNSTPTPKPPTSNCKIHCAP